MKKNSIISIILNDTNVNLYTKLLIFLFYKNKNNDYLISNELILKYLKLKRKDLRKIYKELKKLEDNKIIKIKIRNRRRYFDWLLIEEIPVNNVVDIPNFDWLNL